MRNNILVVEDDWEMTPVWKHILSKIHPNVKMLWASDLPQARSLIEQYERDEDGISLLIADIFLPDETEESENELRGIELFREFGHRIPFVVVSSLSEYDYFNIMKHEEPAAFLHKPLDPDRTIEVIEDILHLNDPRFGSIGAVS